MSFLCTVLIVIFRLSDLAAKVAGGRQNPLSLTLFGVAEGFEAHS